MTDDRNGPDAALLAALARAIAELSDEGCPVATEPERTAAVALRRWRSSGRRQIKQADVDARSRDLLKGLFQQFETDVKLVGALKRDYECIVERIAPILMQAEGSAVSEPHATARSGA